MTNPKVILITGAAAGFGREIALAAARAGHVVYAGVRNPSDVDALATLDARLRPLSLDVTVPAQRAAAVARIYGEAGRLDALINNAGVALGGFLEQLDEDELRQVMEVNFFAVWAMTQAVLPGMREARSGLIVNISSMAGRMAFPGLGAYAASKFALEGMSEAWRHELRAFGVHVVLVEPGAYRTDIFSRNRRVGRRARDPESPWAALAARADARFTKLANRQARDPAEVAALVLSILTDPAPRLRYPIGADARLRSTLVRVAPFSLVEALIWRMLLKE